MVVRSLKDFEFEQGNLSITSTNPSTTGQEVVKEDMVIIGGKERPLKNYEAELRRKTEEGKETMRKEFDAKLLSLQQQTTQPQQTWYDVVQQRAEQEMALTGKTVPVQTILELADSLYQRNISSTLKNRETADKEIRNFKRSIKKDPDFSDIEDDFDVLVEQLRPEQINAPTLEVILNSVRGKRSQEIVRRAKEEGKQEALKETQILGGQPTETTTVVTKPSVSLTPEQQAELVIMNQENTMEWTEQEYKDALLKKQNRFKAAGAKNIPQLMSDTMIK